MENAPARPVPSSPKTSWWPLLGAVFVQLVLLLLLGRPMVAYLALAALVGVAYLAQGRPIQKLFILSAVVAAALPYEMWWVQRMRPEAVLPVAALLLWIAERVTNPVRGDRLTRLDIIILLLIGTALLGAGVGLLRGRAPDAIWGELTLYLFFGVAIMVARTDFPESMARQFFAALAAVAVVLAIVYSAIFLMQTGRRAANDQQHLLNLVVPLIAVLFFATRSPARKLGYGGLLGLLLFATYATLTRAMWITIPLSVLLVWFLLIRHKRIPAPRTGTLVLVAVLLSVVVLQATRASARRANGEAAKAAAGRAETFRNLGEDLSLIARYDFALQALQRWRRNPVLGSGLGDFLRYRIADVRQPFYLLDSSYLTVLWKLGLVGLALLLMLYGLFMKRLWFVYRRATSEFQRLAALATFAAFAGLLVMGIESGILVVYRFNLIWAVLIGIFERWARQIEASHAGGRPTGWGLAVAPVK